MLHTVSERKWELARGVGHSFGANRHERPEDIITDTELIQMFCDVVSKNGNLLIGVGPRPDGTIPEQQQAPLRGLGAWLAANGEAIYGSRPWVITESVTTRGDAAALHQERRGRVRARAWGCPPRGGSPCGRSTGRGCGGCAWWGPTSCSSGRSTTASSRSRCPSGCRCRRSTALDLGTDVRARMGATT